MQLLSDAVKKRALVFTGAALAMVVVLAVPKLQSMDDAAKPKAKVAQGYQFPGRELAALHVVVQRRFDDLGRGIFGISRIGPTHGDFTASSPDEKRAVAGLAKAKAQVLFYTVQNQFHSSDFNDQKGIFTRGPVNIRRGTATVARRSSYMVEAWKGRKQLPADVPKDAQLALAAFDAAKVGKPTTGAVSHIGRWDVMVVPLTATAGPCLRCHGGQTVARVSPDGKAVGEKVKLGSTLGYAVYCVAEDKAIPGDLQKVRKSDLKVGAE